ncbi:MAG: glycoside hydrolase family 3 N-terminal domain-containing protein [Saprospiraceae bacterium]
MLKLRSFATLLLLILIGSSFQISNPTSADYSDLTQNASPAEAKWVNDTYQAMSLDERIGQLMNIRAHSDLGPAHERKVESLIYDYYVGGLTFFQGSPEKQVELTNRYQKLSKRIPLMIAMDAEWGVGMRFKEKTINFPYQLMLGAIQDNSLIYEMGVEVANQFKHLGMHVNYAPVADVNNNAGNPVINFRSFGEDRYNVAVKSYMYAKGMQDNGVMACAKHFPGHGDTDVDSHYDLPVISHDRKRLDSIELLPFRVMSQHGVGSMMVAHLSVPSIDATPNKPTTLSTAAVTDLLKNELNYKGLIFTDGLGMKGVTKHYKPGILEAEAIVAGNDIMLLPEDIGATFKAIKEYMATGKITEERLAESVKKVLRAKYRLNLRKVDYLPQQNVRNAINNPAAKTLKRKLIENALTLVRDEAKHLPIEQLDGLSIASLSIGAAGQTKFQNRLTSYKTMPHFQIKKDASDSERQQVVQRLQGAKKVIVSLHDMSQYPSKKFGITEETKDLLRQLNSNHEVILVVFGNPYALQYFDAYKTVLVAYQENEDTEDLAAQALFGAIGLNGRLPVSVTNKSHLNAGITTSKIYRLGYDIPESVGLNSMVLSHIDTIAAEGINARAMPGCVVLVAKAGKVVFEKAYGHHTYAKKRRTQTSDIFDLASVTKIAAGTLSMMKLQSEDKVDIYQPMSSVLPNLKGTNKEKLLTQDIMAHRAGLKSWIRFYEQTLSGGKKNPRPSSRFYQSKPGGEYALPVTEKLYLRRDMADSIWTQIHTSELRSNTNYKYSDLGFYLVADVVKNVAGQPINQYVQEQFYQPLGLQTATYNPLERFSKDRIPPTEEDKYFRRQRVHGYVHDMGAAMLGGISGHAGLFSNANDLAIIMQMFLNKGYYGGKYFLDAGVLERFTTRHPADTRRGIGFDMQQLDPQLSINMSPLASQNTFGHLGFTGTCVWADPDHALVYIFLSNRTYPSMNNRKFGKMDIRPRIQTVIYEALAQELALQ